MDQNGAVTARAADKDALAMSEQHVQMNVLNGSPVESNNISLAEDNRNIRPRINSDYSNGLSFELFDRKAGHVLAAYKVGTACS